MPGTDAEKLKELKAWLERHLVPFPLTPSTWQALMGLGLPLQALRNPESRKSLLLVAQTLTENARPIAGELGGGSDVSAARIRLDHIEIGPDRRLEALAEIAAILATKALWANLEGFRQRYLVDGLIDPEKVREWVEERRREEGVVGHDQLYAVAPVPEIMVARSMQVNGMNKSDYRRWVKEFAEQLVINPERPTFTGPEHLWVGESPFPIRRSGPLSELRRMARKFEESYGWYFDRALLFILSGVVPPLEKVHIGPRTVGGLPALSRLIVRIDPRTTPRELAKIYESARRVLLGRAGSDRPMSEKSLRLAIFAERYRDSNHTWHELRALWNDEQPPEYQVPVTDPQARQFAVECRRAWSRVTGAKWNAGPGERQLELQDLGIPLAGASESLVDASASDDA